MDLDKITYKINGCAMKVHNQLGNGFHACLPKCSSVCRQEVIYQRCLAIEMDKISLSYLREQEHPIYYDGLEVGSRRADFVVADKVVVELKALINLENVHLAQVKNYLVAYDKPIGLLINFGNQSLQFKKIFNNRNKNT